jgi:hypothetical protein
MVGKRQVGEGKPNGRFPALIQENGRLEGKTIKFLPEGIARRL